MIQLDDDSIITLTDDEGTEVDFLLLDVVEYDEKDYLVLLPLEDEEDEEDNVLILQAVRNGEEESFVSVDNDDVLNAVFSRFTAQLEADAEAAGLSDDEEAPEAE
ncbi:MAG: DUF1292 domain-containing protein [Clostridia bacterium]|nr:DUF1292 domain-containing protein [Clostridia bacterium]